MKARHVRTLLRVCCGALVLTLAGCENDCSKDESARSLDNIYPNYSWFKEGDAYIGHYVGGPKDAPFYGQKKISSLLAPPEAVEGTIMQWPSPDAAAPVPVKPGVWSSAVSTSIDSQLQAGRRAEPQNEHVVWFLDHVGKRAVIWSHDRQSITASIALPGSPMGIAFTPDATTAAVSMVDDPEIRPLTAGSSEYVNTQTFYLNANPTGSVAFIDTATNRVTKTVAGLKGRPGQVAITPDGSTAYLVNRSMTGTPPVGSNVPGVVYVIDIPSATLQTTISVPNRPAKIAISPDGTQAWVAQTYTGDLSIIDTLTRTVIKTIARMGAFGAIAFYPNGSRVYVGGNFQLHVINGSNYSQITTLTDFKRLGNRVSAIAIEPTGSHVLLANPTEDYMTIVDARTNAIAGTVTVGPGASSIAFVP